MSDASTSIPAAGMIHLRQSAQAPVGEQVRTVEIAIDLPADASEATIERALRTAEAGMRGLTMRLDAQLDALRATPELPTVAPAALPEPSPTTQETITPAAPEPITPSAASAPVMKMPGFLKAEKALGYSSEEIPAALGITSLSTVTDFAAALEQLRAHKEAPVANGHGFAEELGPDEGEAENADMRRLETSIDEPDFGPVTEDEAGDGVFASSVPPEANPQAEAMRRRDAAHQRLRGLRTIRAEGAVATPEQREALKHLVITTLGNDRAQSLIIAIWNPQKGERLNAARTRALVEWAKEDDQFEETAALMIDLARQAQPQEA